MRALVQQQYVSLKSSDAVLPLLKAALGGRSQTHASGTELAKLFVRLAQTRHGLIYIMVDALDEAEDPSEVAGWFRDITAVSSPKLLVKVFATSRRLTNLETLLKDTTMVPMEPALVDQDIDRYIPSCLDRISDAHSIVDPSKLRLIHVALQKGHNGLFLWARLLTELLLGLPSAFDVMDALNRLPATLTGLYRRILVGLHTRLASNEPRRRIARRTISWLCFTRTQVTLGALSEALAIEPGDAHFSEARMPTNIEHLIREVLGAFVETLPHGCDDHVVQFAHLSIKDFFLHGHSSHPLGDNDGVASYFPVAEQANAEIATVLFRYLSFPSRATLQADLSIKTHSRLMPYASIWCCTHLRNSGSHGVHILPLVRSICNTESGVTWLDNARILNEDDGAQLVVLHAELKTWRQSFTAGDEWLDEVVPDILRLAHSRCKPDTTQLLKRAYQLTQFLELIGKREEPVKILEDSHQALSRIANSNSVESEVLLWSLTLQLGRMWVLGGRPAQSLDLYDDLLTRSPTFSPDVRPIRTRLLEHSALIERGMGELNKSEAAYKKVCDAWADLIGAGGVHTMRALGGLATVYDMQGRLDEAQELQLRVLTTVEQLLGQSHPLYLQSLHDLGSIYEYQGRLAEAEETYQRCMRERSGILGDLNAKTLTTMHNCALVYEAQGRIHDAGIMCEKVLRLRIQVLGHRHGDTGRAYNSMASVHFQNGNLAEARACLLQAQDIKRSALKTRGTTIGHLSTMVSSNLMAGISLEEGNAPEAWRICQELIANLTQTLPSMTNIGRLDTHPSLLTALHNAGIVKARMAMYTESEEFFQKAYDGRCISLGTHHILTLRSLGNLAWVLAQSGNGSVGNLEKARNHYTAARNSATSLASSQLGYPFGIECLDKALFLHGECCVLRLLGLDDLARQQQEILDGLVSVLQAETSHCLDGQQAMHILDRLRVEKNPILDQRWERLRDVR